jgi:hypothetical protein
MNVELTIKDKPGPLHAFAALDILVLIMLLGFVASTLVHRAGITVTIPESGARFAALSEGETVVLTMKGAVEPVFYLGAERVAEEQLIASLRRLRDDDGVRMVLLRADARLPAMWQERLSEMVLAEGLKCGWLAEPKPGSPAP